MTRRVKQFVEIADYTSLDDLIAQLSTLRDSLPSFAEAELRLKGDDLFGRKLTISFMREQTDEEAACDDRYAEAYRAAQERELRRLEQALGAVCQLPVKGSRRAA